MANLLSNAERIALSRVMEDSFDTFCRDIIVHKEPKKVVKPSAAPTFGYGASSAPNGFAYTPVSSTFPAVITYPNMTADPIIGELHVRIPNGSVMIKVRKDTRNFINAGKTEKITFDDKTFNVVSDENALKFAATEYYLFLLTATK